MADLGQTSRGAAAPRAPSYPSLYGFQVFLVEDETLVALLLEDMLAEFGCTIAGVAATLDQALAKAAATPHIDAAVLDINLGGGDMIFPVADALALRGVPLLFSTAYIGLDLRGRYPQSRILRKPYMPDALARALTGFLESVH